MLKTHRSAIDRGRVKRSRISTIVVGIIASLALTACGDGTDDLAVRFEAHWQCEVQRLTFEDLGALDETLDLRLGDAGITRTEYQTFKARLEGSRSLRQQVAEEYDAFCLQS